MIPLILGHCDKKDHLDQKYLDFPGYIMNIDKREFHSPCFDPDQTEEYGNQLATTIQNLLDTHIPNGDVMFKVILHHNLAVAFSSRSTYHDYVELWHRDNIGILKPNLWAKALPVDDLNTSTHLEGLWASFMHNTRIDLNPGEELKFCPGGIGGDLVRFWETPRCDCSP